MRAISRSTASSSATRNCAFTRLFNWFKNWCNDEFRHGEAFALLMRSDPAAQGAQQAVDQILPAVRLRHHVCARSHPPGFHAALGLDPTAYDYQVFRICSEISKQVFPLTLDTDHPEIPGADGTDAPAFGRHGRSKDARRAFVCLSAGAGLLAALAATFARLYLMPTQTNALPGTFVSPPPGRHG